jgi:hypothetical protein
MRKYGVFTLLVLIVALAGGCFDDSLVPQPQPIATSSLQIDPEQIARALVLQAGWPVEDGESKAAPATLPEILAFQRQIVSGNIVHYSCQVRVGPGQYDVIGVHRVVKERLPGVPVKTAKAIFLLHGDLVPFVPKFLFGWYAPSAPDDHAAAIYWAQRDVDCWGIDQSWQLVPQAETNFSFMANWGMQHDVDNLRTGMGIARLARGLTGSGAAPMILLGYSSGLFTGFACVNMESQLTPAMRHVKAFIPVDCPYKSDDPGVRESFCAWIPTTEDQLAQGIYQSDVSIVALMANLGRTAPNDPSPYYPGFTNLQATLAMATGPAFPPTTFHYFAGTFDQSGMPTGLQYTPVPYYLDFFGSGTSYEPNLFILQYYQMTCGATDMPFDDHLADVRVPVLYVGAAGGSGQDGLYALGLLGSADKSSLIVRLHPESERALDFAHVDLWTASDAPRLVWQPLHAWIVRHSNADRDEGRGACGGN